MKITKIKVGLGNTCGPKFEPIKVYYEYEAELDPEDNYAIVEKQLEDDLEDSVWDFCIDALTKFKGAEEAAKFRKEK